jgi:tetratricopeptide (TPR) repeat protein
LATRQDSRQATETLEEIDSLFDRAAQWIGEHPKPVLGSLGGILALAAVIGGVQSFQAIRGDEAATAVAAVQGEYLTALGAPPGTFTVVEPANPERALQIRTTYAARFIEAAEAHPGSAAAVTAHLEAAELLVATGDDIAAREAIRAAIAGAPPGSDLEALARLRLASALEDAADPAGAAAEYERVGAIDGFPDQASALANAARCWLDANDTERALATFGRIDVTDMASIPAHTRARLRELEARQPKS